METARWTLEHLLNLTAILWEAGWWVDFAWDAHKAAANLRKHGVSFQEAATVFFDSLSATGADPDHSLQEQRFVTFGMLSEGQLLVVAHT